MSGIVTRLRGRIGQEFDGELVLTEREAQEMFTLIEELAGAGAALVSACEGGEWGSFTSIGWGRVQTMREALTKLTKDSPEPPKDGE